MKKIPLAAAKLIADRYGYDQVVIYARATSGDPSSQGEHMTTYGRTPCHCKVAAQMGAVLQNFMGWKL